MTERTANILKILDREYGTETMCYLHYSKPYELLFAVILSAQCTDERVNMVTKDLFSKYDTLEKFAGADIEEMERDIYSIGFHHNKAKNIIACANQLLYDFNGEVPDTMEELLTLKGVGRKTANCVLGNIYHIPSVVVDTHVLRISRRLGLTAAETPEKVEQDLMEALPRDHWILYNMQIITFGRTICTARSPRCGECFLRDYCKSLESA